MQSSRLNVVPRFEKTYKHKHIPLNIGNTKTKFSLFWKNGINCAFKWKKHLLTRHVLYRYCAKNPTASTLRKLALYLSLRCQTIIWQTCSVLRYSQSSALYYDTTNQRLFIQQLASSDASKYATPRPWWFINS